MILVRERERERVLLSSVVRLSFLFFLCSFLNSVCEERDVFCLLFPPWCAKEEKKSNHDDKEGGLRSGLIFSHRAKFSLFTFLYLSVVKLDPLAAASSSDFRLFLKRYARSSLPRTASRRPLLDLFTLISLDRRDQEARWSSFRTRKANSASRSNAKKG